jgi:hypothetical protein
MATTEELIERLTSNPSPEPTSPIVYPVETASSPLDFSSFPALTPNASASTSASTWSKSVYTPGAVSNGAAARSARNNSVDASSSVIDRFDISATSLV